MSNIDETENQEYLLLKAKNIITERTQSSYLPDEYIGAEKEAETLYAILDDAIINKKSTVGLITGPKGSGKSSVCNLIIIIINSTYHTHNKYIYIY